VEPALDSIPAAVDRARAALDALADLGEEVQDEWRYVQDLREAWAGRLGDVATGRADDPLPRGAAAAIAAVADEAARIHDPHRAIDWLSTLPQVVLAALDERP
jgi:hypothetical protein